MISVPSLFRRKRLPARGLLCLALGAAIALAGCQSARVAKRATETQVTPDMTAPAEAPPAESAAAPEPEEFAPPVAGATLAPDGVVRVGLLLPLSGRHAKLGQALLNAAQLALFDLADDRFALIVRDTGGTPAGAQAAARSAIQEGAGLILGPLFATSTTAMASEARAAGVNVISFSNDRQIAGNGVFIMGLAPDAQIDRVVDYASRQGLRRFAVLAPTTPYGNAVMQALRDSVQRKGAELSRVVTYNPGIADASAEVRSLADFERRKQALLVERQRLTSAGDKRGLRRLENQETLGPPDFEAVMLPIGGKSLLALAPLLPYFDIDQPEVRYLGTALWNDPRLGTEPALVGGWFAAPPPNLWQNFKARYNTTFGNEPPRVVSLAYDATALAAVLAGRAFSSGSARVFQVEEIADASGFSGVDGIFRFLPTGEAQRGLAVLEMQRGRFRVLEPAPQTFEAIGS